MSKQGDKSDDHSSDPVRELTQDLDELAGRFRKRFGKGSEDDTDGDGTDGDGTDGDGDTGKALVSSIARVESLLYEMDNLAVGFKDDTGKPSLNDIRDDIKYVFEEIDKLSDQFRMRFPDFGQGGDTGKEGATADGDTGKGESDDGDTGKDPDVVLRGRLGSLFNELDNLATRYVDQFDGLPVDGTDGDGDTGKDGAVQNVGTRLSSLIKDLDDYSEAGSRLLDKP